MDTAVKYDFCYEATEAQSVPLYESAEAYFLNNFEDFNELDILHYRMKHLYSCNDEYVRGKIQEDYIYISTTDNQHIQIVKGEAPTADGGISGYFSDEETINQCIEKKQLNNGKFNQLLQIMPYDKKDGKLPAYKPHVDCFFIDTEQLKKVSGTRSFEAAVGKCTKNNQFGMGGGNQGFNSTIKELIENKCLILDKSRSYTDKGISTLDTSLHNRKRAYNSEVSWPEFKNIMRYARKRTMNCIDNNTKHPSQEVIVATGYAHNPFPVISGTCSYIEIPQIVMTTNDQIDATAYLSSASASEKHSSDIILSKSPQELSKSYRSELSQRNEDDSKKPNITYTEQEHAGDEPA